MEPLSPQPQTCCVRGGRIFRSRCRWRRGLFALLLACSGVEAMVNSAAARDGERCVPVPLGHAGGSYGFDDTVVLTSEREIDPITDWASKLRQGLYYGSLRFRPGLGQDGSIPIARAVAWRRTKAMTTARSWRLHSDWTTRGISGRSPFPSFTGEAMCIT